MASKPAVRSLQSLARRSRPVCECARPAARAAAIRQLSTGSFTPIKDEGYQAERAETQVEKPRWSYTPERLKAPYSFRVKGEDRKQWECNSDPEKLNRFYNNFLGPGGEEMLTEEVKWLAVTHKSFDQGRRGFNDRLAFLGRRILNHQTNIALLSSPIATQTQSLQDPAEERKPFRHPAVDKLQNITDAPIEEILNKRRVAGLGTQCGMRDILRWVPRNLKNLDSSGIDVVITSTVYAIVGAVALQKGGDIAARIAKERVLKPLGIL